eukprot:GILJ01015450.1.p1 GENE.GILJ01015450.1~~GILJ01015450.1.p1  ORF type:complete len:670 (+),score=37.93 GILJ01015450.1:1352-3361(+)
MERVDQSFLSLWQSQLSAPLALTRRDAAQALNTAGDSTSSNSNGQANSASVLLGTSIIMSTTDLQIESAASMVTNVHSVSQRLPRSVDVNTTLIEQTQTEIDQVCAEYSLNTKQSVVLSLLNNHLGALLSSTYTAVQQHRVGVGRDGHHGVPAASGEVAPDLLEPIRLFIGGKGGTGKTQVIMAIVRLFQLFGASELLQVTASTGCAASQIGGSTIHSALAITERTNRSKGSKDDGDDQPIPAGSRVSSTTLEDKWRSTKYLIIDEVSMIGTQLMSTIHDRLCVAKRNIGSGIPFGGISVIFTGDFFQFAPVTKDPLYRQPAPPAASASDRQKQWAIESNAGWCLWQQLTDVVIRRLCTRIVGAPGGPRPSELPWSAAVLVVSRNGLRTSLNTQFAISHVHQADLPFANRQNTVEPSRNDRFTVCIVGAVDKIKKTDVGTRRQRKLYTLSDNKTAGLPGILPMSIGSPVMLTSNLHVDKGLVNGARGTLRSIVFRTGAVIDPSKPVFDTTSADIAYVLVELEKVWGAALQSLPEGIVPIVPVEKSFQWTESASAGSVQPPGLGRTPTLSVKRKQLPIIPAFVLTDYKVQGKSFDNVIVDITKPPGNRDAVGTYVCLSRARSLQGLAILRPFQRQVLMCCPPQALLDEMERLESIERKTLRRLSLNEFIV